MVFTFQHMYHLILLIMGASGEEEVQNSPKFMIKSYNVTIIYYIIYYISMYNAKQQFR